MSYWEKRFERIKKQQMKSAELATEELKAIYTDVLKQLRGEVLDWYKRYAKENNMRLSDARIELDARELKAFKMNLKEYTELAKRHDLSEEHIKMLNQASIRVRLDRSQAIYVKICQHVELLSKQQEINISDLLKEVYEDSYYKTAYETQSRRGFESIREVPKATIDSVISKPWADDGKDFSTRIWENKTKLINTLQSELIKSLMAGEGDGPLINRLESRFKVSFEQARRLAETETAYAQEVAMIDTYNNLDVEQYKILATLDNRTSKQCRHLDGKIFDVKDAKPGVTMPPFHCYCRTTTIPYFDGIDDEDDTRVARDENGKTVHVPGDMTYPEWKERFVDKSRENVIIKAAKDNKIAGEVSTSPKPVNLKEYAFDDKHINKDRSHGVSRTEAVEFVNRARVSVSRWDGRFVNYYSEHGAAYIDVKNKIIKTAFKNDEFDEKIKKFMEVIKKYDE